jgi:hypothetical protein
VSVQERMVQMSIHNESYLERSQYLLQIAL